MFFDIDGISDHSTNLPHMPADARVLCGLKWGSSALSEDKRFVVYDATGLMGAARVWWTLRVFGARDVKILEGGLPQWRTEGRRFETGVPPTARRALLRRDSTMPLLLTRRALKTPARRERRKSSMRGQPGDSRARLRSLDRDCAQAIFQTVAACRRARSLATDSRTPAEIKAAFVAAGVDLDRPIITSCGSGVTAAILLLALETIGKNGSRAL